MEASKTTSTDAWIPENPGDFIEGTITDLDVAWSDFRAQHLPNDPNAGNYPLLTVKLTDGTEQKVHAFRTVLFNEVQKRQPKPGERIKITFTGIGDPNRDGMSGAHLYKVETPDRDPEAVAKNVYTRIPGAVAPMNDEETPF